MTLSMRTVVRVLSFFTAALLMMLGVVISNTAQVKSYRRQLERSYIRSVQEMASHMNAVSADMQKAVYAGSSAQVAAISADVWKEAGGAKAALGNLPLSEVNLDATYRFLSQVGDYSMYLSRKAALEEEITAEERENYEQLGEYARQLSQQMERIQRIITSGSVDVEEFLEAQLARAEEDLAGAVQASLGFGEVEAGFDGYPTLIYDGPFSDHLLQRSPVLTQQAAPVSRTQAQEIAARYAGLEPRQLEHGDDETSRMPSYTFHGKQVDVGVTQKGGYVTYLLNSRTIGRQKLTIGQARRAAAAYLETMGVVDMEENYYELAGGILTVNYAYNGAGVTCYTDLIKVGVAMDDGQAVFYDARGFINNHRERSLPAPRLSEEEAAGRLSPSLEIQGARMALIPTAGGEERLTYEFFCTGLREEEVLVYINVETGAEEQILILLENENGTLAI